jgi:4-hydroxy-3-methylbut-2-enyl diphosphate reductase
LQVTIDPHSGFCFGVVYAIEVAERELQENSLLYCLGDIVHNDKEVERLKLLGLVIITHDEFRLLHDCKVMIRAHGEPPETYSTAHQNNIQLIDASCPIVLNLQNQINRGYLEMQGKNGQIVIYGNEGHAEVNALKGQTDNTAIVIGNEKDLAKIDFKRPVRLYSQTTKSVEGFRAMATQMRNRMVEISCGQPVDFESNDSICRQVSNRVDQLKEFVSGFDIVVFVSGLKSSNGMVLYQHCKRTNPVTYLVSSAADVESAWFGNMRSVGICGATSTPKWLMEEIACEIRKFND